jgi:hypothetical protein
VPAKKNDIFFAGLLLADENQYLVMDRFFLRVLRVLLFVFSVILLPVFFGSRRTQREEHGGHGEVFTIIRQNIVNIALISRLRKNGHDSSNQ